MTYTIFDKIIRSGSSVNEKLAQKLHRTTIKKSKRRGVDARFKSKIWAADLAEVRSLPFRNQNVKCLSCVIDFFTKYARVRHFKDKNCKTVFNASIEIVKESNFKAIELWVDQGKKVYNRFMQKRLNNIDILMQSTHNECKSVIAERFIKEWKTKIYKKWQLMITNLVLLIWINW